MDKQVRRHLSGAEQVAILSCHLRDGPVSALCGIPALLQSVLRLAQEVLRERSKAAEDAKKIEQLEVKGFTTSSTWSTGWC